MEAPVRKLAGVFFSDTSRMFRRKNLSGYCGVGEYAYAWMSCETERPDELGRTTLRTLGDVCGTYPKCAPYMVVDGVRVPVRTDDIDDDEGIAIVINDHPRLWTVLMNVRSLKFGMKGKQTLDLTLPGLAETFSQVLATCGGGR